MTSDTDVAGLVLSFVVAFAVTAVGVWGMRRARSRPVHFAAALILLTGALITLTYVGPGGSSHHAARMLGLTVAGIINVVVVWRTRRSSKGNSPT